MPGPQEPHLEIASLTPLQEACLLAFIAVWCGVTHRPAITHRSCSVPALWIFGAIFLWGSLYTELGRKLSISSNPTLHTQRPAPIGAIKRVFSSC